MIALNDDNFRIFCAYMQSVLAIKQSFYMLHNCVMNGIKPLKLFEITNHICISIRMS